MEYTTYTLKPFNANLAQNGHLCVVTTNDFTGDAISSDSKEFIKSCIPTKSAPSEFTTPINGTSVTFNYNGKSINSGYRYLIFLASTNKEIQHYGNAIKRTKKVTTIRTENGVETKIEDYKPSKGETGAEKNVLVSALNARDNFAIQALHCIMKLIPDLKDIGDDERDFYCKLAYQWAASMMDNAAQARATFVDQTTSTEQSTDITELETNSDKLLNNILYAMERVQQISVDKENQIASERTFNPTLNSQIESLKIAIEAQTTALVTGLANIATAINNLNTITSETPSE